MEQNHIIIDVSTTKYPMQFALIDIDDAERVARRKWTITFSTRWNKNASIKLYPRANINGKLVYLHRFIMNAKKNEMIDHINGNTLDNRKSNLRFVTFQQNIWNSKKIKLDGTSKFKGVVRVSNRNLKKPFYARITQNRKTKHIGAFATEKEAHDVYEKEALKLRGEHAYKEG